MAPHHYLRAKATSAGASSPGTLVELIPPVRACLPADLELPDRVLLDCLAAVAGPSSHTDRWRAAFNSEVGRRLAMRGTDLNTALSTILRLVASRPA